MLAEARAVRRTMPAWTAALVALSLAACTSHGSPHSGSSHRGSAPAGATSALAAAAVTRWWSNSAVTLGSTIDPAHPDAAAARLHPSQADYCGMLSQTVAAGKSILPDVSAINPALLTSSKAFVAEIEKVAPAGVTTQWRVLGPTILALVKAGGDTSALPAVDLGALTTAGATIADDAQRSCGVDLYKAVGIPRPGN